MYINQEGKDSLQREVGPQVDTFGLSHIQYLSYLGTIISTLFGEVWPFFTLASSESESMKPTVIEKKLLICLLYETNL
jgi:hypothetical protein